MATLPHMVTDADRPILTVQDPVQVGVVMDSFRTGAPTVSQ